MAPRAPGNDAWFLFPYGGEGEGRCFQCSCEYTALYIHIYIYTACYTLTIWAVIRYKLHRIFRNFAGRCDMHEERDILVIVFARMRITYGRVKTSNDNEWKRSPPSLRACVYGFDDARALSPLICLSVPFGPSLSPSHSIPLSVGNVPSFKLHYTDLINNQICFVFRVTTRPARTCNFEICRLVGYPPHPSLPLIVKSLSASSRLKRGEREGREGALSRARVN